MMKYEHALEHRYMAEHTEHFALNYKKSILKV
jgi:hypothetical protein